MATKKISELEAINAAEDNDVLVIVDTSESTTNKITKGNLLIGAGHTIQMTLNENYQIVLVLKNAAGTALSTQTIDLPNENAITNLTYNNGILTVTKQSGATSQINLTGLIEGLVTESDFNTFVTAIKGVIGISTNTYDSTQTYNTGDIVVQSEKIYKANQDNITGTFDSSKWDEISLYEYQKIQDEAIAENYKVINKLNEKLENQQKVISQLPQVEGQGTSITLENTIEAPFAIFDVEGNSDQETTEGYNMLDLEKYSYSASGSALNGGTVTIKDGVITVDARNATGATTALSVVKIATADSIEAGTYYFGVDVYGAYESTPSTNIWEYRGNRTLTEKFIIKQWKFAVTQGNVASTPILVSNDPSKRNYEPYTNGASPNPSYEQPIDSCGDNIQLFDGELELGTLGSTGANNNSTTDIRSKNYVTVDEQETYTISSDKGSSASLRFYDTNKTFISTMTGASMPRTFETPENAKYVRFIIPSTTDIDAKVKLEKGTVATPWSPYGMGSINEKISNKNFANNAGNGYIASDGSITVSNVAFYNDFIPVPENETKVYYYGSNLSASMSNVYANRLFFYDENKGKVTVYSSISTPTSYTIPNGAKYVRASWLNAVENPMLVFGEAIPYVPHEEQDYSIPVQQPMRSIGDIRDGFVKVNGVWNEVHLIGNKILNGSEGWSKQNTSSTSNSLFICWGYITNPGKATACPNSYGVLSNYFKKVTENIWTGAYKGIDVYGNQAFICVSNDIATTVDDFKRWLNTHNVEVNYVLQNPTYLPCTPEQVEQIENKPSTYKDFTIINSEDVTKAYLEVSGIRDINTMFDKVTNAIVSLGGNV